MTTTGACARISRSLIWNARKRFMKPAGRSNACIFPSKAYAHVAQSAACAHLHNFEQRCCRSLLLTRDRMPSNSFLLT
jgi:hypothetical protein